MTKGHVLLYVMAIGLIAMGQGPTIQAQTPQSAPVSESHSSSAPQASSSTTSNTCAPGRDTVHLANGQVLAPVKVLRATGPQVQIQVWEGVAPLYISQKLVTSIEYGPNDRDGGEEDAPNTPQVITGAELSATFHTKLTTPLSDAPIVFEESDFLAALELLGEEAAIRIVVEPGVREIPVEERRWQVEIPPESSFDLILQEYLLPDFPQLAVRYAFNHIRLRLAE